VTTAAITPNKTRAAWGARKIRQRNASNLVPHAVRVLFGVVAADEERDLVDIDEVSNQDTDQGSKQCTDQCLPILL
jgi:hypothetical protein